MSVWQTPQAASRTRTSPARGSVSSTSCTASGWPNCSRTAARIFIAPILRVRAEYAARVIIVTGNELQGYEIEEVFGEVFGLTVRSRNIGSTIGAGLKSLK